MKHPFHADAQRTKRQTVGPYSKPRFAQVVAAFQRRVGETPHQRLRWVVDDFLRLDLDLLTPGELEAKGDDLRMIAVNSLPAGVGVNTKVSPMPPGVLRRYQDDLNQGLRELLGKDCRWPLSGRPVLERRERFRIVIDGDEKAGILGGIAHLVVEEGDRLRTCKDRKCGLPFVATKRQEYCTIKHSQRERNRIRLDKEKLAEKGEIHG